MKTFYKFSTYVFALFSFLLIACTSDSNQVVSKQFEYVHLIPDSLRTPEQQKIFNLLENVIKEDLIIENNHFKLNISKDKFLNKGIPLEYYDLLKENVKENNKFIDSLKIEDVNLLLENMKIAN